MSISSYNILIITLMIVFGVVCTNAYSKNITTDIRISNNQQLGGINYIVTGRNITFTADIFDSRYKNDSLLYHWFSKNETLPTFNGSSQMIHIFGAPDEDNFIQVVVLDPKTNNTGTDTKKLAIRDPINWIQSDYRQHIYHGDLFSAYFKFNGTKPFVYNYTLIYNSTKDVLFRNHGKIFDDYVIIKPIFLRSIGNYILDFRINNIASAESKVISIKVLETARMQSVNYVPIISCILAVLILLSGVALHFKFKKIVNMETADLDFTRNAFEDEEWDEVQTFGERVRYLLFGLNRSEQRGLLSSELNRSRVRLII